jgi:ferric-dicitrate binding protein FerR (iron transport regulator)
MSFFQNDTDLLYQKLTAYCLQELPETEHAEVEQWIGESKENAEQYRAVQRLLDRAAIAIPEPKVDVEAAWQRFNQQVSGLEKEKKGKVRSLSMYWLAAAAVVTALLFGGWIWMQQPARESGVNWIAKTGFDTLLLPDGTMVLGNGNATVRYKDDFNEANRELQLSGNAFFSVHRDTTLPFSVSFDEGKVTVLGTQFFIDQDQKGFVVKVTEGKVKAQLLHQKGETILTRGKKATFTIADNRFLVEDFAAAVMLKYNNTALQTIVKDLMLAKGIRIYTDEQLAGMKLTVDFTQSSTEEIVQTLELLTQASLQKAGANQYRLIKN